MPAHVAAVVDDAPDLNVITFHFVKDRVAAMFKAPKIGAELGNRPAHGRQLGDQVEGAIETGEVAIRLVLAESLYAVFDKIADRLAGQPIAYPARGP